MFTGFLAFLPPRIDVLPSEKSISLSAAINPVFMDVDLFYKQVKTTSHESHKTNCKCHHLIKYKHS